MQAAALEAQAGEETQLAIKVGFTWGPVVTASGDVFGDTVNVCARLSGLGSPRQVLTTQETIDALPQELRSRSRPLYPIKLKGRVGEIKVCEVLWRADPDMTEALDRPAPAASREWILKLTYGGDTVEIHASGSVKLGRDKANDVVVPSTLASRVHARVYARGANFVIADQSSNGTYVMTDGDSREVTLRREEALLGERGYIGLGGPASKPGDHVLRYRLEARKS
jgi:adenylate cyclase